jgi:hypothetical protein
MSIKLDSEMDLEIDVSDLEREFKRIPSLVHGWSEIKASSEEAYGLAKAEHEELRSQKYLDIRSQEGKITEANLEARIDVDPDVKKALRNVLAAKRDLDTLKGFTEGLSSKKDMLIQLGADSRKQ